MVHLAIKPVLLSRITRKCQAKYVPTNKRRKVEQEDVSINQLGRLGLDPYSLNLNKAHWVVGNENCIIRRNATNRAKQTLPSVCRKKYKNWSEWHNTWLAKNVLEVDQAGYNERLLGRAEDLKPNKTHCISLCAVGKVPYRTYTKFKVEELSSS
eukprot:GFUD01083970.1.p1 GENE.GFUD01083970.1~~GFUD01083970.1.p1  ORF type:complete len:161 (-),score=19.77 GFUD01083970.1:153-614(-)